MGLVIQDNAYTEWLKQLKDKIRKTQLQAALSANRELILLYWDIGKELYEKQEEQGWG